MVRYYCSRGYVNEKLGTYKVGQTVPGFGEVQNIEAVYCSVVSGCWMTLKEVLDDVREYLEFTHPDHVYLIGSGGVRYTCDDLRKMDHRIHPQ